MTKYFKKLKLNIVNLLIVMFLIHGFIFFIKPQELYNINSEIRNIKYIILLLILFFVMSKIIIVKVCYYILAILWLFSMNIMATGLNFNYRSLLTYIIPLVIFFTYDGINKYMNKKYVIISTYFIASTFSYIEFFILKGVFFGRFASSGYRVVSIFVNPNNFAIVIIFLTLCMYNKNYYISILNKMIITMNTFLLVLLSGSRTALLVFILILLSKIFTNVKNIILHPKKVNLNDTVYCLLINLILIIFIILTTNKIVTLAIRILMKTRNFETMHLSGMARINQYINFFNMQNNFIFPWSQTIFYVDNIYLHIWGMFGILTIIIFILFNIYIMYIAFKKENNVYFYLHITILLTGLSTNFLYIWPLAYFYWFLVADILAKKPKIINLGNYYDS